MAIKTTSETHTIFDFFEESEFMIPEIQRNFTWTAKEQVSKLVTDLKKFFVADHNIVPQYFLGTCILYEGPESNGTMQIMDGQQRVTSLVALFAAIKSLLENRARSLEGTQKDMIEDHIELISEKILFHDEHFKHCRIKPKAKLDLKIVNQMTKLDGKSLIEIDDYSISTGNKISRQPLSLAFNYFHKELLKFAKSLDENDPWNILINFSEMIGTQVLLTKTITKTLPMAFQMFVSVNGAGKPLITYDVLRGLVMAMAHTLGLEKKVNPMLSNLNNTISDLRNTQKDEKTADSKVTDCLLYWLESRKGKNIQNNQVIDIIEHEIIDYTTEGEFGELLDQFRTFAVHYIWINNAETKKAFASKDSYTRNRILRLTKVTGGWNANHIGVLIALHMSRDDPSIEDHIRKVTKIMQLIEWFEFRGFFTQISNRLETILPAMAKAILDGVPVDRWEPKVIENMAKFMKKKGSGFDYLGDRRLTQNQAKAFLHKITATELDITANDFNAVQLMPFGSPGSWNSKAEKEDNGTVSELLGNWFLISKQNLKDIKSWTQDDQLSRAKSIQKHSIGGDAKNEISVYVEQISSSPNAFNTSRINARTAELIKKLELLFPEDGPRYILSPPK